MYKCLLFCLLLCAMPFIYSMEASLPGYIKPPTKSLEENPGDSSCDEESYELTASVDELSFNTRQAGTFEELTKQETETRINKENT